MEERSDGSKAASMYMYGRPRAMYILSYAVHNMEGSVHVLEVLLHPITTYDDDPHHFEQPEGGWESRTLF
jgi:hypothetical protein